MKKCLAIDGNSLLNRAYYGIRYLSNSKGQPTNAVYGLLNIIIKILKDVKPDYMVAAFDLRGPTFRHEKSKDYKSNRHGMPDELAMQLPFAKRMLELMGMTIVESPGYEGDDILGTISRLCYKNNVNCIICSGDRDCLQLVDEKTIVKLATNRENIDYNVDKVIRDYGIKPKEIIDLKALMGDSSDNIKGVKGIGKVSAITLIRKYHSIENIFKDVENLDVTPRQKKLLLNDEAYNDAKLSKELATINCNVPIDENLERYCKKDIDEDELIKFFDALEFKNAYSKLDFMINYKTPLQKEMAKTIKDPDIDFIKEKLKQEKRIVFIWNDTFLIFVDQKVYEFTKNTNQVFRELIVDDKKEKWTYNLKEIQHRAINMGVDIENVRASGEISGYILDVLAKNYSLEDLKNKYARGKLLPGCFINIMEKMEKEIKSQNMEFLEKEIEIPLAKVLAQMESTGFCIDEKGLKKWGEQFKDKINDIDKEIKEMVGEEFNINSPKDVSMILFEKLGLPPQRKTKTGYSTDAEVLEKLIKYHPVAKLILEYRNYTKLKSTYVEGLLKNVSKDGRVHSIFKQTETRTGRISSSEPNMQNIPVRNEFSSTFRKFFVAPTGKVLVDADYSQIELRILAQLSKDEKMVEAFKNKEDIHLITASEVFSLSPLLVPKELRRRAKIINFSIIYGVGPYSLSQDIGVSLKEAKEYIDKYFESYSGVRDFMDRIVMDAKDNGYVRTMFGRRRDIPEFNSKNHSIREFAQRAARNTVVQGSAADIIKIAMVKVSKRLEEEQLNAKLILQVHDELLIEVDEKEKERAALILKEEMENAVDMDIPLIADVNIGKNWYDAKEAE